MTEHIFLLLVSIVINLYGSVALSQDNVLNRSHIVSKTAISGLQKRSYDSISPYDNIKWVNWGVGKTVNGGTVFRRSEGVLCATFLQDGNTAVIGEEHRTVVWNCQTGDVMKVLGLSKDETMSVCCLLGDSLFATATGNVISIWSARSLKLQETICERGSIYEMGFSNDGTHLFTVTDSANSGRNVRLWDYGKKQVIIDFTEKFHYVSSASFSPDGRSILLSGYPKLDSSDQTSNSISIWDIASGKVFQRLLDDIRIAHCVCYSPDGRFIAAGFERIESNWGESNDTTLKVWDASSGECVMAVTDYTTDVKYLAFSPSGDRIAFAAGGGVININMINSSERTVLRRNNEEVQGPLAFSPNGKLLISGAPNTKAVIWNVERGIMLRVLDSKHRVGHRASVCRIR
jgi:WD40 repeat protein